MASPRDGLAAEVARFGVERKHPVMRLIFATPIFLVLLAVACAALGATTESVRTKDHPIVDDAFLHGYSHNKVVDTIAGQKYRTLTIQCKCVDHKTATLDADSNNQYDFFSVWTRDLYWGALGWIQAGDQEVLDRAKGSIQALIACKNRNKADGHVKGWPLNNGRYYVPQAYCMGGAIAEDFFPYDSESQADFLLFAHLYWKSSGDTAFIKSIWDDIAYVVKNIEIMDTSGNSLPDDLWGSYDYQGLGQGMEEPLMCAKASAAYRAVAEMARAIGNRDESKRLAELSGRVKKTMNLPISEGGLWKPLPNRGGYYVNHRVIKKGEEGIDDRFIPYESLVPMFYGMTSSAQNKAIFDRLDGNFDGYYDLKWGPMYVAPAGRDAKSVLECSTTPWLGFLDVYLRCKHGREQNRSRIFSLLIKHAYDVPGACFSEGAGINGGLTGGSGRTWDNGNFFHCLISGVYGIEKTAQCIGVVAPTQMQGFLLTELKNVRWSDAVYDFMWAGVGTKIVKLTLDMVPQQAIRQSGVDTYQLSEKSGKHSVVVTVGD